RPGRSVTEASRPYTLIAELTYRCPLRCVYCSNPLDYATHGEELDTDTWLRVFREAEDLGVVQLNLTGGEPLVRDDLERLVEGARGLDLYTNLITSGVPVTRERLARLRALGLDGVQLSIQDVTPQGSDRIAGLRSFDRKREVAAAARSRLRGRMEVVFVLPDYYREFPKACMDGWGRRFLVIAPDGLVMPCHAADAIPGLAFERARDRALGDIWRDSPGLNAF